MVGIHGQDNYVSDTSVLFDNTLIFITTEVNSLAWKRNRLQAKSYLHILPNCLLTERETE